MEQGIDDLVTCTGAWMKKWTNTCRRLRSTARVVPITDNTVLKFAIIRGLRPDIRLHVLQSSPTTIDDVLKAARVAETAIAASQPTSEVGELRKQIASLIEKLSSQPAVAAVNTADPPRRVTFHKRRGNKLTTIDHNKSFTVI